MSQFNNFYAALISTWCLQKQCHILPCCRLNLFTLPRHLKRQKKKTLRISIFQSVVIGIIVNFFANNRLYEFRNHTKKITIYRNFGVIFLWHLIFRNHSFYLSIHCYHCFLCVVYIYLQPWNVVGARDQLTHIAPFLSMASIQFTQKKKCFYKFYFHLQPHNNIFYRVR